MENEEKEPLDDLREFLEKKVKEDAARPPAAPPAPAGSFGVRHPRLALGLQLAVIAAAAVYLYLSFPELKAASQPRKQLRLGAYDLNPGAEACISRLWKLAGGLEQPDKTLCPVSNLPYTAREGGFACPAPEKHGLSELHFLPRVGVVARGDK